MSPPDEPAATPPPAAFDTEGLPPAVAAFLADGRERLYDAVAALVGLDTRNPPGRTVEAVDQLADALAGTAVETERVAVDPEKPNLLARLPGERDRTLAFNGHLDTVPYDAGDWERDPLGERDGDRLYGRGASDMKGAVGAMLQVLLAHAETGTTPPVDLAVAFVSDEETGGDAGLATLLDGDRFRPDACVVGETTSRAGRYSVSVADRGNVWLTVEAEGTAAHGSRPMVGENAVDRLYAAVERVRQEFGGRELDVAPAMEAVIEESAGFYEPEAGAEAARRLYRSPTVNLGVFEGGTAINTVPASARARIDVRVTAGVETADVLGPLRGCLAGLDGVSVTEVSWTQGSYEPPDSPVVEAGARAAERVVDDRVYRRSATGGGDAKVLRHEGIPTVEFGFGTQTAHGTDEYTTTTALARNAVAFAALPYEYADAVDGAT